MELKINGKEQQLKFNFASLALWEEKIVDDEGKKQDDEVIFDTLFTGLAQKSPRVLIDIANGGLAYLGKDKPTYAEVFDAVSDIMGKEGLEKLAESLMAELTANGFFKGSMKQWKESTTTQYEALKKIYEEDKKPARSAKKEEKEQYAQRQIMASQTLDQFGPVLEEFDKLLKATGITL